jgi:hypothetical protein
MKRIVCILVILFSAGYHNLFSHTSPATEVYLITCGPGTETYSIYGHSALRIVVPAKNSDLVYNWGVFDFSTPHFAYKFARGRLEYLLDTEAFDRFLRGYIYEQRWVQIQKINMEPDEIYRLLELINENLKPENLKYRYDFFYDDCSTRIRDLLEKSLGNKLIYPPAETKKLSRFRYLTGKYQRPYPWLNFGIDLLMGTSCDKKASFRERMFLPIEMQNGLSEAMVNHNSKLIPLLQNPEIVLDFDTPKIKQHFYTTPWFAFSLLLVLLILLFGLCRRKTIIKVADIILFSAFSCLAVMMLFTNFITDHQQMKWNLNLIWLSPFIFICLAGIFLNKEWFVWFRIVFILCFISFIIQIIFRFAFNSAFIPLILILLFRSSARAGFSWNPFSLSNF